MDKRRYVSRNSSPRRDKVTDISDDITGNAAKDGFTIAYRKPLVRDPYDRSRSPYREYFACDDLMDEGEAEMNRMYPNPYD